MTDAVLALHHRRHERLADQHRADQVVLGQRRQMSSRGCRGCCWARLAARRADVAAGAIDEDIDPAELLLDLLASSRRPPLSPILPVTPIERTPMRLDLLDHVAEIGRLAVLGGRVPAQVMDRDIGAARRELARHHAAEARPEPVTNAILPASSLAATSASNHIKPRALRFAALLPVLPKLVFDQFAVVAALPRRAKVGIVRRGGCRCAAARQAASASACLGA